MKFVEYIISSSLLLAPLAFAQDQGTPGPSGEEGDILFPLPGDLRDGVTSDSGRAIESIIRRDISGENNTKGVVPTGEALEANQCRDWYGITDALTALFVTNNACNDLARAAVRLGFHDAGAWSSRLAQQGQDFGGADGSIYHFEEWRRSENAGLERVAVTLGDLAVERGVSVADMIQWASAHATVTCTLGPRMRTWVGRRDATQAAPNGLIPTVDLSAETIDTMMREKGISPHDLAALLGAHSTAKQFTTDPSRSGEPLDSTPEDWDVAVYAEVLEASPVNGTFRLASDVLLANYTPVGQEWARFVDAQGRWNFFYAAAFVRLSLLGVNNINADLFECTDALPAGNFRAGTERVFVAGEPSTIKRNVRHGGKFGKY